ncbi:MAG: hypothetical protein GEU88_10700 [Solirubrobacterales bacterium]|nr:hypothetical protein [Solirubrobacterales bacterium]
MSEGAPPLVALVGFKRSKLSLAGGVRVLVVPDGTVRILGKKGRVDLDAAVGELSARLTRTRTVELRSDAGSLIVYGFTEMTKVATELEEIAARESADAELIGPTPSALFLGFLTPKDATEPATASRAIAEALHERGVGQG